MNGVEVLVVVLALLVVALVVVSGGVRRWMVKFLGFQTEVEGHSTTTEIKARQAKVRKITNEGGSMNIDAAQDSEVIDVTNKPR